MRLKQKIKIGTVVVSALIGIALGGCGAVSAVPESDKINPKTTVEQNNPIEIWSQNSNGIYETLVVVDKATGVEYVVVSCYDGVAIVPRYNLDGSLYQDRK